MTASRLIVLERSEKVPLPEALFCDECSRGASAVETELIRQLHAVQAEFERQIPAKDDLAARKVA